jgi:hypothetical protein
VERAGQEREAGEAKSSGASLKLSSNRSFEEEGSLKSLLKPICSGQNLILKLFTQKLKFLMHIAILIHVNEPNYTELLQHYEYYN